jgi:ketosteroid isomerase-like protein
MLERFARSSGVTRLALRRAIREHDVERVRALLPEDFVFDDHRRVGPGRIEGGDAYVAWVTSLFELARDAIIEELYYLAVEPHASLAVAHSFGTVDGGAFENVFVQVEGPDNVELFELDDLELARARFEELRPDALRIPANAASRARDRCDDAWSAGDWTALRALTSPDFVFEDRGKRAMLSGDVELWIQNARVVSAEVRPSRIHRERIGTAGDRIELERFVWRAGGARNPVEGEHLRLTEVDAEGRIRASIRFDPDDRAAAFAEAQARFVAGEAATIGGQAPIAALYRSVTRHDWETVRGCLAEDAVMWDRRALGILGTLDRDQWVESLRAAADVAPDWDAEVVRILRWNGLGRVQLTRMLGTRDGGPFENLYAHVILTDGDHIQRFEYFDVSDLDRALARFEELCAGLA